jgi:tryptophan synthase beta chain
VLHGSLSAVLQDEMGQILEAPLISAGLDYPGSGPEHAHLRDIGRATYLTVSDAQAWGPSCGSRAWRGSSRARDGPRPALRAQPADSEVDIVCCSGRGDKDLAEVLGQA